MSKMSGIPAGQYQVVSVAVDLTGRKLIDEICHIGAFYQPGDKVYSQYVMPHREVSRASVRTHGIRIVTSYARYRVLKDAKNMRTLRTKSEYSALSEFMEWLKEAKGKNDGVLLAFHDNNRDQVTPFLMDALVKYKLADDFFVTVKGFVNVCKYAEKVVEPKDRSVTLRALCRRHLDNNDEIKDKNNMNFLQSAKDRARYTFQILQKLSKAENEIVVADLLEFGSTREDEIKNLEYQRELAEKVRTLKPIFNDQIRKGFKERSRAVVLRRYLIDGAIDYECLKKAYEVEEKAGVKNVVSKTAAKKKEKDMEELVELIFTHFKTGGKKSKGTAREIGAGDSSANGVGNGTSASSSEIDDDEFEEAQDEEREK